MEYKEFLEKLPPHKCGLYLEHNQYKDFYDSIEKGVASLDSWVSEEERQKALATGEIWVLQWYPDTPVGFNRLAASSLEMVMENARQS